MITIYKIVVNKIVHPPFNILALKVYALKHVLYYIFECEKFIFKYSRKSHLGELLIKGVN